MRSPSVQHGARTVHMLSLNTNVAAQAELVMWTDTQLTERTYFLLAVNCDINHFPGRVCKITHYLKLKNRATFNID